MKKHPFIVAVIIVIILAVIAYFLYGSYVGLEKKSQNQSQISADDLHGPHVELQEERPEDYAWYLLSAFPPRRKGEDSIIRHGQLVISVQYGLNIDNYYITIKIKNRMGEREVYVPGYRAWLHEGQWKEDFFAFAKKIKAKRNTEIEIETAKRMEKTNAILNAYKGEDK